MEPREAKTLPGEVLCGDRILPRVSSGLCELVTGEFGRTSWRRCRWSQKSKEKSLT